ncbi:XRE family transcriptional regulator [Meridianimarinicoccus roseus]|jgi:hypothetical protein|uniref:XRE family transcriptional regulator n=1 Tax=Meridianimarinicoccus roseus TaxID=2072018 RepID=A0A2V2LP74_9RHOB|nr:helix-turn-helix transcriptional regulator [Meridianimarinicoccus roseus]PWR03463.1 XRE family transcriptional regulator [Meridianimarinicoccus roseus]
MPRSALTGTRIRERRTMLGLRQSELAARVEISPSYLNLIEHNRRRIGGKLLTRIARALGADVASLTQGAETEQLDQLGEAAAAHPGTAAELDKVDELVGRFPGWAALLTAQQRRIVALENRVAGLVDRLAHDPFLSAALHDLLSKVSSIQSTASILVETEDLDENWRKRFQRNLHADSGKLAEGAAALVAYLDAEGETELGVVTPQEELETFLNRTGFHVAGLETPVPDLIAPMIAHGPGLQSDAGRALAHAFLDRYRAEALAMPLAPFEAAARETGFDPARLSDRFGVPIPAVFRRLASLPGARIGLVVCDGAGALTLRKTTDLLPLPRFGSACALWPVYRALTRPMAPVRAVLEHSARPAERFLCYAMAHAHYPDGFAAPAVYEASMILVPPDLVDLGPAPGPVSRIGTTCRVCPLPDCAARRDPSILGDGTDGALTAGRA